MTKYNSSQYLAKIISTLMIDKKAIDIKVIDVRKVTTLTDFFILCTSESQPQTKAITTSIEKKLKEYGIKPWHIEGYNHLDWVLLDYVNIVAQIFSEKARKFYDFERHQVCHVTWVSQIPWISFLCSILGEFLS